MDQESAQAATDRRFIEQLMRLVRAVSGGIEVGGDRTIERAYALVLMREAARVLGASDGEDVTVHIERAIEQLLHSQPVDRAPGLR